MFSSSGPLVSLWGVISFLDDPDGSSFNSFTFFPEMSLSELVSDSEIGHKCAKRGEELKNREASIHQSGLAFNIFFNDWGFFIFLTAQT